MTTKTDSRPEGGNDDVHDDDVKGGAAAAGGPDDDLDDDDLDASGEDDGDLSIEELAIEAGWKPKDQWKGDTSKHVSAAAFLRQVARSQTNLKKKVREQDRELAGKEAEFDKRLKRLETTNGEARRREVAGLKAQLDAMLEDAIETGDKKKIRAARDRRDEVLDELNEEAVAGEPVELTDDQFVDTMVQNLPHPTVQKPFFKEHAWLLDGDDDEACEAFAEIEELVSQRVVEATQGKRRPTHKEFEDAFEAAERLLKRSYRHRLGGREEEDDDMDDDDTGGRDRKGRFVKGERERGEDRSRRRVPVLAAGNRSRGRDLASRLPPEALKAADADIKAGLFADRAEYAKVYFREMGEKVD